MTIAGTIATACTRVPNASATSASRITCLVSVGRSRTSTSTSETVRKSG